MSTNRIRMMTQSSIGNIIQDEPYYGYPRSIIFAEKYVNEQLEHINVGSFVEIKCPYVRQRNYEEIVKQLCDLAKVPVPESKRR